jgi:CheY-like chemotaxis protein
MEQKTILYIEDNIDNRTLVRRVLLAEGYKVLESGSASEAMICLQSYMPDLILMDINLPNIDGYTLTEQIHSIPRYASIPIVALTANVLKADQERITSAGCAGSIQKPIDIDRFPMQVRKFLQV